MVDDGGARAGTREEEGSLVAEKEGSSSLGVEVEQSRVRHRWLLQIGGRAVENEREMGGGGRLGAAWRKENGRERGPRAWRSATRTAGLGWLWLTRSEAAVRGHGGSRLANRGGQRGTCDAVRRS
jgi:hypothetical protein